MIKNFTNAQELLDYYEFPKWKKIKERLTYNPDYHQKNDQDFVIALSLTLGLICMFVTAIVLYHSPASKMILYINAALLAPSAFIFLRPRFYKLLNYALCRKYENKVKKTMTETALKDFIKILSTHKYSPYQLNQKQHYNQLILAVHHNRDYVPLVYQFMNKFYENYYIQMAKEKDAKILADFADAEKAQKHKEEDLREKFNFIE